MPHPAPGSAVVVVVVEEGGAGGPPPAETPRRAFLSVSATLTLAVLGSTVLPVPFAFSCLGVLPGILLMLFVALANALVGTLLLRCAGSTGKYSFEGLAEAVGGRSWKVVTQVSLILLLFGNCCADYALLADMGSLSVQDLFPGAVPPLWVQWLTASDGRVVMALLGLLVVFPLSCLRRMRQLEQAAAAGVAFVVLLTVVVVRQSLAAGLPAIASGELPLFRPAVAGNLPEAVAVLSFAFYSTPMLLPLLKEMPPGKLGVDLTCRATQLVTIVVAGATYGTIGLFAAARYGLHTEGDILVNRWLPGRWDGALDAAMTVYLSISMAPMAMALRYQLQNLLVGEDVALPRGRQVALTAACLLASLLVALGFPTAAEKMFAVTGATAVCAVCYIMPVAIHLKLYLRSSSSSSGKGGQGSSSGKGSQGSSSTSKGASSGGGAASAAGAHRRHPSFSFDQRQRAATAAATAAAVAGSATAAGPMGLAAAADDGSMPEELTWLLSADHHASAASLRVRAPVAAAAVAAAAHQQQQQGAAGGEVEAEEESPTGAAALLRGHRWTDLSLNRWLHGQSYDSIGMGGDSQSATPGSPGGWRASLDSMKDGGGASSAQHTGLLLESARGSQGSGDRSSAATASGAAAAARDVDWQLLGLAPPPWALEAAAGAPRGLEAGPGAAVLQAVPEAAEPAPAAPLPAAERGSSTRCAGSSYPCIADARGALLPLLWHLVLPAAVMATGVAFSLSALWLAVAALL